MDIKAILKNVAPYALIVFFFVIISFLYFSPVIEGKQLMQMDNINAKGMAQEINEHKKETGEDAQWTNSMFGGMPTYHIGGGKDTNNIFRATDGWLRLKLPYETVAILFLYMLGFFILLQSIKLNKWISFVGALAFAFASYKIIIIGAGHITKAYAIGYMPIVLAGVILAYRGKYLAGGLIAMLGLGYELAPNHVQITYYLAMFILILAIGEFIYHLQLKKLPQFFKASGVLLVAALFAVAPSVDTLWKTYEYSEHSIRGKNEQAAGQENAKQKGEGLDRDYALAWSYGVRETLTLMIPNAVGGATGRLSENSEAMDQVDPRFRQAVGGRNQYWGSQPFTEGPVYFGAIVVFLFILGLFYIKGPIKWSLLAVTILAVLLAWGKNFGGFTDIFFYNVPFYNKFRTVSMILVLAGLAMPMLAFMTVHKIITNPGVIKENKRGFFIALGVTGGLSLLFALFPGMFDYVTSREAQAIAQQKAQNPNAAGQFDAFISNLESARMHLFKQDAFRSFGFIAVAALLLWLYPTVKGFKSGWLIAALGFLAIIDLWSVDKRYVNNDQFKRPQSISKQLEASKADQFILKDEDHPNFRVMNITRDPFRDSHTSYFHQSVGGYHGAKMRRYQDVIENYLAGYAETLRQEIGKKKEANPRKQLANMPVLNMLNTRYIIYNRNTRPLFNNFSTGTAWFPDSIQFTTSPGESLNALGAIDASETAVVHEKFRSTPENLPMQPDSVALSQVKRIRYEPDHRVYQVNAKQDELLVFSEIYYEEGWKATLDDKPADILRANYVLKALKIPEGPHKVEFTFEPKAHEVGIQLSMLASIIVVLLIVLVVGYEIYRAFKTYSTPKET